MDTVSAMAERGVSAGGGRTCTRWRRRLAATAVAALCAAACSGGSDDAGPTTSADVAPTTDGDGDLFDPVNPDEVAPPVAGTEVRLDDEVIIVDDVVIDDNSEIPPTTTDPQAEPGGPDAPPPEGPVETSRPVPLPAPADVGRIVSLSPTHTETLFALGLGEFVVAVDGRSDFPAEAAAVRRDDLSADDADLSVLLSFDPDVVIVGEDPTDAASRIRSEGIVVFEGPPPLSLAEAYEQMRGVAAVVGHPESADALIADMQTSIDRIVSSLPPGERTYFHEIDPSLFTITPGSFVDSVYGELDLVSIVSAGPADVVQVSNEEVFAADPDVLMLADVECCAVTVETVAARPGWSTLSAVRDGAVVELQEYMVQRWGPRIVDLVEAAAGGAAMAG